MSWTAIVGFLTAHWRWASGGIAAAGVIGLLGFGLGRCGQPSDEDVAQAALRSREVGRSIGLAEGRADAREQVAAALGGSVDALEQQAADAGARVAAIRERLDAALDAGRADSVRTLLPDLRSLGIEVMP